VLLCALLLCGGCFGGAVRTGTGNPGSVKEKDTGVSWLWGLTETETTANHCRNGLSEVEVYWPWWGFIPQVLTLGIVTPITKVYRCS
jgi:hypothetical protein